MYTKSSLVLLTALSFIILLIIPARADQKVEGTKKQNVIQKIESYIQKDSKLKNGFLINNSKTGESLNLNYDYVHESVKKTDDGRFFACVDFTDNTGNVYDLDFYLEEKDEELKVNEIVIHKKNGKSIK